MLTSIVLYGDANFGGHFFKGTIDPWWNYRIVLGVLSKNPHSKDQPANHMDGSRGGDRNIGDKQIKLLRIA